MKIQNSFKRNALLTLFLFTSFTAITYALGTWNTGFRANNGTDTTVDINVATLGFDDIIVENDYGQDLFVPTKTFTEIKSMWDNTPDDTCLYTELETIVDVAKYESYASYTEAACDTPAVSFGTGHPYIDSRRFQILTIESPGDLEAYINFTFGYSGTEAESEEHLKIFLRTPGGVSVPKSHFVALYNDGGATGTNGPDLDYNNDGTPDLYFITIDDAWAGPSIDKNASIASEDKVKLFSGTNYIRIEGANSAGDYSTGEFSCESGDYTSGDSASYNPNTAGRGVWFSSGRCGETALFDKPFQDATLDMNSGPITYRTGWESVCDVTPSYSNGTLQNYISSTNSQMIAVYVPKTMVGYLNFRGSYGEVTTNEAFNVYKRKPGGSLVEPYQLLRLWNAAGTGPNPPDWDYDNDGTDDFEKWFYPDASNDGVEAWHDVKAGPMTFFKGTNYMRIDGHLSYCEGLSGGGSVGFDSVTAGAEGRVWITLD